jgi:hypothetical protein
LPLPDDHLRPIWRGYLNGTGVGTIGLDPREAAWVLVHGADLDGKRFRASLKGWDGVPDKDGRVTVRLEIEA